MKVVILAGGFGTRLSEVTDVKPKPMVEIGGKPILWHIMKLYSHYGFNEFIICLGYKGFCIKEWFSNYAVNNNDVTFDLENDTVMYHNNHKDNWKVTLVDTGLNTMTAGRIKRIREYVRDETFMVTYGDGVSDVDIGKLVEHHKGRGKIATLTAVIPEGKFGALKIDEREQVLNFSEKTDNKNRWVNGGFFVFEPKIFDHIEGDADILEKGPLPKLAQEEQLSAFKHYGFWEPMDKLYDQKKLEKTWQSGEAPWKVWDKEGYRKILITGNLGYVGPMVVRQLRSIMPKAELIGFDIGYFANNLLDSDAPPESLLNSQVYGDVRSFPEGLLTDVDAVVHLAAISNDPMGNKYEQLTMDVNYRASVELAKKAKRAGVKSFVYASSCSVYGTAEEGARTEESDVNPLTVYAKSKVYTERDLKPLADSDFKITCLRFSTACGMSDRLRLDLVLNDFVASAVVSGKIEILSDGTPWRPLINTNDMARAINWAILRNRTNGGDYLVVNVGRQDWNYQVRELAGAVKKIMPEVNVSINKYAQADKRSYKVSFELFNSLAPDFQPVYDLEKTITELRDGLRSVNFHDKNFRESKFTRLKALERLEKKGLLDSNLKWRPKSKVDVQQKYDSKHADLQGNGQSNLDKYEIDYPRREGTPIGM